VQCGRTIRGLGLTSQACRTAGAWEVGGLRLRGICMASSKRRRLHSADGSLDCAFPHSAEIPAGRSGVRA